VSFGWRRTTDAYRIDPEYGYAPLGEREFFLEASTATAGEIEAARDVALQACAASSRNTVMAVMAELGRLRICTASRSSGTEDTKLMVRVYTDRIAQFPEDVAVWVIRQWSETEKWWPSLGELVTRMDELMVERRAILAELERL
jgi:hypothetical protein